MQTYLAILGTLVFLTQLSILINNLTVGRRNANVHLDTSRMLNEARKELEVVRRVNYDLSSELKRLSDIKMEEFSTNAFILSPGGVKSLPKDYAARLRRPIKKQDNVIRSALEVASIRAEAKVAAEKAKPPAPPVAKEKS